MAVCATARAMRPQLSCRVGSSPVRPAAPLPLHAARCRLPPRAAAEVSVAPSAGGEPPSAPAPATSSGSGSAPARSVNENFTGDMLKPSVVNTPWARLASVVVAVAVAAGSTLLLPARLGAFLHVTSYAVWLGTQLWNTFFVGLTMFKSLPRQTFGRVQAKLFPMYFSLTAGANLLAMGTLALGGAATTDIGVRALVALGVALATTLLNWLWLEPKCTNLMFERYDLENLEAKTDADRDRIAVLYKQFGKWHGISSLLNLVGFCVAISHGWYLASLLTL